MGKKKDRAALLTSFIFGCGEKGEGEGKLEINKEMSQYKKNIRWYCVLYGKFRCFGTIMCDMRVALEWLITESLSEEVILVTEFE